MNKENLIVAHEACELNPTRFWFARLDSTGFLKVTSETTCEDFLKTRAQERTRIALTQGIFLDAERHAGISGNQNGQPVLNGVGYVVRMNQDGEFVDRGCVVMVPDIIKDLYEECKAKRLANLTGDEDFLWDREV